MGQLILDTITFSADDLPERVPFGGEQNLAIRKFPGGGLDIQSLGAFDDPITWSGTFMYQGALAKALKLDNLRISAKAITLKIGTLSRQVVISSFKPEYENEFSIPYSITLQPLTTYNGTPVVNNGSAIAKTTVTKSTTATTKPKQITHVVKSGDSLYKIANKYFKDSSKWTQIAKDNKIKNPSNLAIGSKLTINNPIVT